MFLRKSKGLVAALVTILSITATSGFADNVTLNAIDGSVSMTGDLLGYDGETYTLGMLIGNIEIEASQVTCEGATCPNVAANLKEFAIAGTGTVGDTLLPTLIEVFALDRGGDLEVSVAADGSRIFDVLEADGTVYARISINAEDSLSGFSALLEGSAVIAMSTRQANDNELSAFELSGKGALDTPAQEHIVALDGVIATVNPNNPVRILSLEQLGAIFAGGYDNWAQLGGNDAPIRVYRRDESADSVLAFAARALAPRGRKYASAATILETDAAVSDAVAADMNGIGISTYAQERNALAVTLRSVCGQLFSPSEFSIKTEEYPLTERLYLYTAKTGLPDVAGELLAFIASPAAQSVVRNAGFVDQSSSRAGLDAQGRRLAQAIVSSSGRSELLQLQDLSSLMLDAERLSFTLHYDENGDLDGRAMADIQRLAVMIQNGEFSSRQMLIFGFSDNTGAVNAQLVSTQAIAQKVRDEIVLATGRANLGNVRISPIGNGRVMPSGCNETAFGIRQNNRVEIWVK